VVNMRGADLALQNLECLRDIAHDVRMADIEADTHVIEVRETDEFHQSVGSGQFVWDVLQQNAHPERLGKGTQVLDRSHCHIELRVIEGSIAYSYVLH